MNTQIKIDIFKKRNQKINRHLYEDYMVENIDYRIEPVSGVRLVQIKPKLITNVLDMSLDDYDRLYPGLRGVIPATKQRIKNGLVEIDEESGLSNHALSVVKSTIIRAEIDEEDGLSINQRKGIKIRETNMKIDENGLNVYQKIAIVSRPKQNNTLAVKHKRANNIQRPLWSAYRNFCQWITNKYKIDLLDGKPTGKCGTVGAWQIDHKFSAIKGFHFKMSPFIIGGIHNLCVISWEENIKKKTDCSISLQELFILYDITDNQSKKEFVLFEKAFHAIGNKTSAGIYLKMKELSDGTDLLSKY
jgi:hypothetical protein